MDGATLRRRRKALKMTQTELARRLGTSQQTVFKWESGQLNIQHPPMMDLALRWLEHEHDHGVGMLGAGPEDAQRVVAMLRTLVQDDRSLDEQAAALGEFREALGERKA